MSDRVHLPQVDKNGVPWCDEDRCPFYDGKRCEATGFRPAKICEPAVIEMAADIVALRAKVRAVDGGTP